jgi:PAS domain S-box-containing protein
MTFMDVNKLKNVFPLDAAQLLRQRAETIVSGRGILLTESLEAMSPAVILKWLHELQVHQIELEMQNEELRKTHLELDALRARYFDLYDLAPISYCTVSEQGVILEANLAAAELLGEARSQLVGQRISRYIGKEYQDVYYLSRKLLDAHGGQQGCELHLHRPDGVAVWVYLNITTATDSKGETVQRMVLTDITNAKVMALAMRESESRLRTLVDNHA